MESKKQLWDLYTAREEYNPTLTDRFNRNTHWLSKNRNIFTPSVSDYLIKNGLNPRYPDNKKFGLCLTHDIDVLFDCHSPRQQLVKGVKNLIKLDLRNTIKTISETFTKGINPNFHVSETLKYGKIYNARSSFYFLSLSSDEEDFNYEVSEINDIYDLIARNNGEIGLHGGHNAYNDVSKIRQEREKLEAILGKNVNGYRNHYLHFRTPSTWEFLDELNFKYDTTYGFADCVGFRNGMCHPFNPYSNNKNTFLELIELPLIVMDCTLWRYMNLSEKSQFELCKSLIDTVAQSSGVFTLLWHNTQMQGYEGQLYNAILKYAYEKGAWMPSANEMVDFWKEKKYHEISKELLEELKY